MPDGPRPGELARLTSEVRTLAKPHAEPLIGARGVVHRSPTLKAQFQQARVEGWTPEQLAGAITPELERALDCEPEAAVEVAQYLADEFFQMGEAVLVCDRTTGKAIARISDADMYQPPPVRRESGDLVQPLPRLNPNLEGFLVSYIFEQERDRQVHDQILARLPRTAFLTADLDPRVRAVTRAGRVAIAQAVRESLPDVLEAVGGSARAFLGHFDVVTDPPEGLTALPRRTAEANARQNIADPKAMNTRFSWETTIRARTGVGFVREMAAHLVDQARTHALDRQTVAYPLLTEEHLTGRPLWTANPETARAIQAVHGPRTVFPCLSDVGGAVGFSGITRGAILIHPGTYEFHTREVHLRWEMRATMEYTLYVNWDQLRFLEVTDIPVEAIAEIL